MAKPQKRAVERAMATERAEKDILRHLWADEVEAHDGDDGHYLYLTLPGNEARDIEVLHDRGILRLTETGAVAEDCARTVVAIAAHDDVILELSRRFPGLKIVEQDVNSALSGPRETAWPQGELRDIWCARVINLDLDEVLKPVTGVDDLRFRVVAWLKKVALLHAEAAVDEWTLCLTLHAETPWSKKFSAQIQDFLKDNFGESEEFAARAREVLGDELFALMSSSKRVDCASLSPEDQAHLLLTVVPKAVVAELSSQWDVEVSTNCAYGLKTAGRATMGSWVFRITRNLSSSSRPRAAYKRQIATALQSSALLEATGEWRPLITSSRER